MTNRRPWSDFELEVMRLHYATTVTADLAELFGRPASQVYQRARKLGLAKSHDFIVDTARDRALRPEHGGRRHHFEKGHTPKNKGLRRPGWAPGNMACTQFKKGERRGAAQHNYVPIGTVRITRDGYLERKVTDDPNVVPARRWVAVHRLVWAAAHGEIAPGHIVTFRAGQRTAVLEEITLDRLECISRADNCRRNSFHNYGPEMTKVVQLRGAITRQINRRMKEESK